MLTQLPTAMACVVLMIIGAVIGGFVNWAIYSWAIFLRRPISPWMRLTDLERDQLGARQWMDRIPVYGWLRLRREAKTFGPYAWLRPCLIDVAWIVGLPIFFHWQLGGGLIGWPDQGHPVIANWAGMAETWFWLHSVLLALMCIATFIDFDEKMIPDSITVPGTLIALVAAAWWPWSRLPELGADAAGATATAITFASPHAVVQDHWCLSVTGLLMCVGIYGVWLVALLPRISPFHLGIGAGLKYTVASILRPKRKKACSIRIRQRGPFLISFVLLGLAIVGIPLIVAAWALLPGEHWISLFGAFVGMAVSGGLVWAIRIVGGLVLGQQAMGFGDVTLMTMVGAFIGWQASLAAFIYGIIVAMLVVLVMFIFLRESRIAFGPYLCAGSALAVLYWQPTWTGGRQVFFLGSFLLIVLLVSLILMAILLPIVRFFRVGLS